MKRKQKIKNFAYTVSSNGRKVKTLFDSRSTEPQAEYFEPFNIQIEPEQSTNTNYNAQGELQNRAPLDKQSRYIREKTAQHSNWNSIRGMMVSSFEQSLVPGMNCSVCGVPLMVVYRCDDCCVGVYLCEVCLKSAHQVAVFHKPYKWQARAWVPYLDHTEKVIRRSEHFCSSLYKRCLVAVDHKGRRHRILFEFCLCEPESVTLIRHHLWPSSPKKPAMCFHMHFMESLRVIYLQGSIPVKDFCDAFKHVYNPYVEIQDQTCQDVYKVLINESFEEYRAFIYQCDYLRSICPEFDDGTKCPACPVEDEYPVVISMDANFGLVRKKSSGLSHSGPNHAGQFFASQAEVDTFVLEQNVNGKKRDNDCSDFKAGSALRSNKRYEKLDETAIFGAACRHEMPIRMFSLKHGERLAYPVFMLQQLLEKFDGKETYILYDIVCMLDTHLKGSHLSHLLDRVKLAIPIFHCYGHQYSCQVKYNPRRVAGLGLTDGETMERLWSYLRSFSKITKEMTASHRIDVLSDALIYYTQRKILKIGLHFVSKMAKAKDTVTASENVLRPILEQLQVSKTEVAVWCLEEQNIHGTFNSRSRQVLSNKKKLLKSINKHCIERKILLEMMKKYADGQAIAIKLQKCLGQSNKQVKKLVASYNTKEADPNVPETITYEDALKGEYFGIGETDNFTMNTPTSPFSMKREAIELFCLIQRGTEEQELLEKEIRGTAKSFQTQHDILTKCIMSLPESAPAQMSLLISKAVSVEQQQLCLFETCRHLVDIQKPSSVFFDSLNDQLNREIVAEDLGLNPEDLEEIREKALCMDVEDSDESDNEEEDKELNV